MSKKILVIFFLLVSCNNSEQIISLKCNNEEIVFTKKNEISINDIPSRFVTQNIANYAFELESNFLKSPLVNISREEAGFTNPVCILQGNKKFEIGKNNDFTKTVYVTTEDKIYSVPNEILSRISLNPINYIQIFSETNINKFSVKEGNTNSVYKKKNNNWFLNDIELQSQLVEQFTKDLISNKFSKTKQKKNPTFLLVTDLNVIEVELDNGVWLSAPDLHYSYLSNIPEEVFLAGSAGIGRKKNILDLKEINKIEIISNKSNFILNKNNDLWTLDSKEADQIFVADYVKFLKDLKVFYFMDKNKFKSNSTIKINDKYIIEIGDFFILPNAELGNYARFEDQIFVLSERQIKKLFPNSEIFKKTK